MKASFKFILAALAATVTLVACTKETTPPSFENDKVNPASEGSRVIAVSFGSQAKTILDGLQPKFEDGKDTVLISNTKALDTCVVSVDDITGKATISTILTGVLTAVYPYKAAKMSDSNPNQIDSVLVSTEQSGKFADANICMAKMKDENDESLSFVNKTALFIINPPDGDIDSIIVKSLAPIVDGVARTGTAVPINTDGVDGASKCVITASGKDADGMVYVAFQTGVKLTDLSFDAGPAIGLKGIPKSKLDSKSDVTVVNTAYTIDNTNWHPYVAIGGKKWATMNIGATEANPNGNYYMWGAVEKAYTSLSASTFTFGNNAPLSYDIPDNQWNPSKCFAWENCNFTDGVYVQSSNRAVFTKYTINNVYAKSGTADKKNTLDLSDDVANASWGGSWHMPTGGDKSTADFAALANACKDYSSDPLLYTSTVTDEPANKGVYYYNGTGSEGIYFVDEAGNKLFLPAAGSGDGVSQSDLNKYGRYWASALRTKDNSDYDAFSLRFDINQGVWLQMTSLRYRGFPVRPVSD